MTAIATEPAREAWLARALLLCALTAAAFGAFAGVAGAEDDRNATSEPATPGSVVVGEPAVTYTWTEFEARSGSEASSVDGSEGAADTSVADTEAGSDAQTGSDAKTAPAEEAQTSTEPAPEAQSRPEPEPDPVPVSVVVDERVKKARARLVGSAPSAPVIERAALADMPQRPVEPVFDAHGSMWTPGPERLYVEGSAEAANDIVQHFAESRPVGPVSYVILGPDGNVRGSGTAEDADDFTMQLLAATSVTGGFDQKREPVERALVDLVSDAHAATGSELASASPVPTVSAWLMPGTVRLCSCDDDPDPSGSISS